MSSDESKSDACIGVEEFKTLLDAVTVAGTYAAASEASATGQVIATHSGSFHCDEALATGMLCLLPRFKGAAIVRTRKPDDIAPANVVVDVGGVYDVDTGRFDHHQKSFTDVMSELDFSIRLSSAGLVYRHFGKQVIQIIAGGKLSEPILELVYRKIYKNFVREVDAIDNGVDLCEGVQNYRINTNLSARVSFLNPSWNEDVSDEGVQLRFKQAMLMTTSEFISAVRRLVDNWLPARALVEAAYNRRNTVHSSGCILKLEGHCPWKSHLRDIEAEKKASGAAEPPVLYVLYQDQRGAWRIQCVSVSPESFVNRKSMPAAWRGLRDEELSSACGVPGCIFVHVSGFIGGNKTYEGVMRMAELSVESDEPMAAAESTTSKRPRKE